MGIIHSIVNFFTSMFYWKSIDERENVEAEEKRSHERETVRNRSAGSQSEASLTVKSQLEESQTLKSQTEESLTVKSQPEENLTLKSQTEESLTLKSQTEESLTLKSQTEENLTVKSQPEDSHIIKSTSEDGLIVESQSQIFESQSGESLIFQTQTEEESLTVRSQAKESQIIRSHTEAPKRLCEVVKVNSTCLESNTWPLPIYQVPLEEEQINVEGCKRYRFGNDSPKTNRTIMVMGATGAGKSTLIDGMINYILGVQWEDEYRFKLVKEILKDTQAESQTSEVTVYKLNYQDGFKVNYSLTIIDTPGFGDTRGIERDRMITEQIRELFTLKCGVSEIDAVCFVAQASLARLTPSQRYVFDSVLSIFGKDIADNLRVLVTFADGQRPPVLEAINASGVPCPQENGSPVHFKFNNSALFAHNNSPKKEEDEEEEEEEFDYMFWNMGNKSMKKFFIALNKIETKSLSMTKEVLKERKQLENLVENLQKQVQLGLSKLEEIKQTSQIVEEHKAEISRNANFEFTVTVTEPTQIDISGTGIYITNCQQCHYTCHDNCLFANDEEKKLCGAMGPDGKCKVCPNNCIWSVHFNQKYKWEYKQVTRKETINELKDKYDIAQGAKNTVEALMNKLEQEYDDVQLEVTMLIDRSSASLNRLKEIALKPDPLSTPDYIDMLIEGEKSHPKPGWQNRVKSLMDMKVKAEYLTKVNKGEIILTEVKTQTASRPKSFMSRWFGSKK